MPKAPRVRKVPAKLGAAIDALYTTRQHRLSFNPLIEEDKRYETALREHLINTLPKSEASGVAGRLARAQVTRRDVPQIENWEAFCKYVAKTKQWDLLVKRVNDTAVIERWENGKKIPGVGAFTLVSVSVNKL